MKPVFRNAHAETFDDFWSLAKDAKITFSYVCNEPAFSRLELDLPDVEPDEQYLAFNLVEQTERGKRRLLSVGPLEIRAGRPSTRLLPYWTAFIRGIGNFDTAYSLEEARALVLDARAEVKVIEKLFEKK